MSVNKTLKQLESIPEDEREFLAVACMEIAKLDCPEQELLLKKVANPKCSRDQCYGRGYTGWHVPKPGVVDLLTNKLITEGKTPDEIKIAVGNLRTPIACEQKECSTHAITILRQEKYLRDRNKAKLAKEAEAKTEEVITPE